MADALTAIGLVVLCVGVGLLSVPVALMVGGGILLALGLAAARLERPKKTDRPA